MPWQIVVAVVLAIPVILIPVAFAWYLNLGGIPSMLRKALTSRVAQKKEPVEVQTEQVKATE